MGAPGIKSFSCCASLRASPSTRCFAAHLEGRLCGARKRVDPFYTQHLRASMCAEPRPRWLDPFASLRAGYAGLLSAAPLGLVSRSLTIDSHF
jgi:hypothetical protein